LLLIRTTPNIMANPPQIETISTGADKAKLAVAGLLVVAAVVAFYMLAKQDLWMRVAALIVLLAAAVATFFTSEPGKQLIAYGRDSAREVRKVVWPTRNEALQMTGYVFAFVFVMALFLFLTDKTLEWLLYDLILGWKR
jgi:preprotein translocase subunit SecE